MKEILSQKKLKDIIHYDPLTGIVTRKKTNKGGAKRGATPSKSGWYKFIVINKKRYMVSRLVWFYMEGYWPEHQIDHKNRKKDDNRWNNLRHATSLCNSQNKSKNRRNVSGFNGVSFDKKNNKWVASITINRKLIKIGRFDDVLCAALARYTVEAQCPYWKCNYNSELVKAIRIEWPAFLGGR